MDAKTKKRALCLLVEAAYGVTRLQNSLTGLGAKISGLDEMHTKPDRNTFIHLRGYVSSLQKKVEQLEQIFGFEEEVGRYFKHGDPPR